MPKTNSQKNKPWLNADGSIKTDQELKEISKKWRPSTWEAYLESTETEWDESIFVISGEVEECSDQEYARHILNFLDKDQFPKATKLKRVILYTLKDVLSPMEFQVINQRYWKSKTYPEISKKLGITESSARTYHARSIKKLRKNFFQKKIAGVSNTLQELGVL